MGTTRSDPAAEPALPLSAALAATGAGAAGMLLASHAAASLGLRAALTAGQVALGAPALLLLLVARDRTRDALPLRPLTPLQALLAVVSGGTAWVGSLGLVEVQAWLHPPPPAYLEMFRRLHAALRMDGPGEALVSVLAVAVLPAISEELLFRGVVLGSALAAWGAPAAVLFSALLFALVHLDPHRFLFTLALGIALGVLRVRARSLLAPALAHAAVNAITLAAARFAPDAAGPLVARPLTGALLFAGGAAATVLAIAFARPAVRAS